MSDFKTPEKIDIKKVIGVGTEKKVVVQKEQGVNKDHIRKWSNIPKRYRNAKFEPKSEQQKLLVTKLRENFNGKKPEEIRDVVVYGSVGAGKTHIACGYLNAMIEAGVYCRYVTQHELLEHYFRKNYTMFDGFKKVAILVIDELGKRKLVDWQLEQLEELLSYRYNEMLPTVLITNLKEKSDDGSLDFKAFVGERIVDRLRDNRVIRVTMQGESFRGRGV